MSYFFFFSYARGDLEKMGNNDPYLTKFYHDLTQEISQRTALPIDEIGFRDEEDIPPGEIWPNTLADALKIAKVFIYIYSPFYFTREWCGKEWTVFTSRINKYMKDNPECRTQPPLMIPVLWRPVSVNRLPACAKNIQFAHYGLGKTYVQEGLHYMMKLSNSHGDEYQKFIIRLGERIVQVVENYPLPELENLMDIKAVKNAFEETVTLFSETNVHHQHSVARPDCAQFVYVAGRANEFQPVKQEVGAYSNDEEGAKYWKPYWPPIEKPVVMITQKVATDEGFVHEVLPLTENLITMIKNAKDKNKIVIIIVDPWTLKLRRYSSVMQNYDEYQSFNCAVLVCFNFEDQETKNHYSELRKTLEGIFVNKTMDTSDSFRDKIDSLEKLTSELTDTLEKTKQKIVKSSNKLRKVKGKELTNLPTL